MSLWGVHEMRCWSGDELEPRQGTSTNPSLSNSSVPLGNGSSPGPLFPSCGWNTIKVTT